MAILFALYVGWRMNQVFIYSSIAKVPKLFGLVKDRDLGLILSLWLIVLILLSLW
jgi:hypothetical protein